MTEHAVISDPEIHEPKNITTASAGQVYVADGSGSGSWQSPSNWTESAAAHAAYTDPNIHEPKGIVGASANTVYVANGSNSGSWQKVKTYLTVCINDIGTAGDTFIVSPVAGTITKIYSVVQDAPATTDTNITTYLGGVAVTGGALLIAFTSSAAGDVDTATPSANNVVSAGQAIRFNSDGGASNVVPALLTVEITH